MNEYELDKNEHREWLDHIKESWPEILILPSVNGPDYDLYFLPRRNTDVAVHPYGEIVHTIKEVALDPESEYTAQDIEEALEKLGWLPANVLIGPTWDDLKTSMRWQQGGIT
jgi:hypothetical protein